MIKTWLKHKLAEECIHVLFNELYMNFLCPRIVHSNYGISASWTIRMNNEFGESDADFIIRLQQEINNQIDNELIQSIRRSTLSMKFTEY